MLALVGGLVALAWSVSVRDALSSWALAREAARTIETNELLDLLLQGAQNLAFERGRTNVLLRSPEPARGADLEFIAARRREASSRLDRALASPLAASYGPSKRVTEDYAALADLRSQADAAFAAPRSSRDPTFAARWFDETSGLVADLIDLSAGLALEFGGRETSFRSYARLKVTALSLRNTLGIEASRVAAGAASGASIDGEELALLASLRGRSEAEWDALGRERPVVADPAVDAAMAAVEAEFFGAFRPLQDRALAGLRAGIGSPVPAAELTAASVPALDSIASLMGVLAERTALDAAAHRGEALRALLADAALALLALGTGAGAMLVLVRRLLDPMRVIARQLDDLASGDLDADLAPAGRDDEMARAREAMLSFRASLRERQALLERLERLSQADGLTGLANRRHFDEYLAAELRRAERAGHPLALAMIDVDRFKAFNDRYGHLAGDDCLRRVAAALAGRARRPGDLAARYGGEEFVVVLPDLGAERALEWAEAARLAVRDLAIAHEDSEAGAVTVSCGVASVLPGRDVRPEVLIERADAALYRAKREGRNRVALAE